MAERKAQRAGRHEQGKSPIHAMRLAQCPSILSSAGAISCLSIGWQLYPVFNSIINTMIAATQAAQYPQIHCSIISPFTPGAQSIGELCRCGGHMIEAFNWFEIADICR